MFIGLDMDHSESGMNSLKLSIGKGIWKKVLLAILLLGLLAYFGDVSSLKRLPEMKWGFVSLIFLCTLFFTLSHNFRWKGIVDHISGEKRESFSSLYRYLLNSYAFGIVVPLDVSLVGVRSYYLRQSQQLSMPLAIFSVLLDRFLDVVVFVVLALPFVLIYHGGGLGPARPRDRLSFPLGSFLADPLEERGHLLLSAEELSLGARPRFFKSACAKKLDFPPRRSYRNGMPF